jgi:hypothetical protein
VGTYKGGFKFMALSSGKKITGRSWDTIPMPDTVIARVNTLGSDQPEQLTFTDRLGRQIGDFDENAITGIAIDDLSRPDDDDDVQIPRVDGATFPPNDKPKDAPHINADVQIPGVDGAPHINSDVQIPGVDGAAELQLNADVQIPIDADVQIPGVDGAAVPDPIDTTPIHLVPELRRSARNKTKPRAYTPSMS